MYNIKIEYNDSKRKWHDYYENKCMLEIIEILQKIDYKPQHIEIEWQQTVYSK